MIFKKGFTIIELLVVIAIISVLAAIVLASVNGYMVKARDARRKADLRNIALALEMYYANYGSYPTTGASVPDSVNTRYSDSGVPGYWMPELISSNIMGIIPLDPQDHDQGPWCWSGHTAVNTIYTYTSDGQHYILCAWMGNHSDKSTLQYQDAPNPWNPSEYLYANYNYSGYNYVIAK